MLISGSKSKENVKLFAQTYCKQTYVQILYVYLQNLV